MTLLGMKTDVKEGCRTSVIYEQAIRISKSRSDLPMDVLHEFIKNIDIKKSHILRIEIFEEPPKAVISLNRNAKRNGKSKRNGAGSSPTNFLNIDLKPMESDEGSILLHYTIVEARKISSAASDSKPYSRYFHAFWHSLWQRLRTGIFMGADMNKI